ncbi:MAG: MarR family winged helix-turn-helix transcriptional regulator [Fimbriimonadaceae bacterium]|jgi:MarR family transcriptional regulator for hemolysin|nr:MarR family winged helix-turn-helix transcriptional regulator [Fimbriimonadaceae bacterium]
MIAEQLGTRVATLYELQSAWLEPRLREKGIRWSTFQLLMTVMSAGQTASQVEIARRLGVTPATLSETVQAHVEKGYLEQVPSAMDRRVRRLVLTDQAIELLDEIRSLLNDCENLMMRGISAKDVETCTKVLNHMIGKLEIDLD